MKILITGATGTAGADLLRQAVADPDITQITCLVRKKGNVSHPKIRTLIHTDFLNYSTIREEIRNHDAMFWCLGISQTQVKPDEYFIITYDYVMAFAREMKEINPEMRFVFLSGMGADQTEKSDILFAKVKGKAEKDLIALPLKHLYIVRPGGIRPTNKNPNTAFTNKLMYPIFPLMELLAPSTVISSGKLGLAMLRIVKNNPAKTLFNNSELRNIAIHNKF